MGVKIPGLDEHATAIGYVCIQWSHLQLLLDFFIDALGWTDKRVAGVTECFVASLQERESEKLKLIVALCIARNIENARVEQIKHLLDYIDNTLRPLRNRVIHDAWFYTKDAGSFRRRTTTKISKPKSNEPFTLQTVHRTPMTLEEVDQLATNINTVQGHLNELLRAIHISLHKLRYTKP